MAAVSIRVGGRSYAIDCRDGEQARVAELGELIADRAATLSHLGTMGEGRLLLSVAILIADELVDLRAAAAAAAERIEAMATGLEAEADTPYVPG